MLVTYECKKRMPHDGTLFFTNWFVRNRWNCSLPNFLKKQRARRYRRGFRVRKVRNRDVLCCRVEMILNHYNTRKVPMLNHSTLRHKWRRKCVAISRSAGRDGEQPRAQAGAGSCLWRAEQGFEAGVSAIGRALQEPHNLHQTTETPITDAWQPCGAQRAGHCKTDSLQT